MRSLDRKMHTADTDPDLINIATSHRPLEHVTQRWTGTCPLMVHGQGGSKYATRSYLTSLDVNIG